MPAVVLDGAFVLAHHPHWAKASLRIAADRRSVDGGRVDRDPMMTAIHKQVLRDAAHNGWPDAAAV